jgi:hypothetical protein
MICGFVGNGSTFTAIHAFRAFLTSNFDEANQYDWMTFPERFKWRPIRRWPRLVGQGMVTGIPEWNGSVILNLLLKLNEFLNRYAFRDAARAKIVLCLILGSFRAPFTCNAASRRIDGSWTGGEIRVLARLHEASIRARVGNHWLVCRS